MKMKMDDKIAECPICGKGYIQAEFTPGSLQYEPYFHKLPNKIYCTNCETEFSSISLDKGKIVDYKIERTLKQKYDNLYYQYEKVCRLYEDLNKEYNIVYEDLMYINVYRCKHCGHYTMVDFKCHNCGADRTVMEDLGNE